MQKKLIIIQPEFLSECENLSCDRMAARLKHNHNYDWTVMWASRSKDIPSNMGNIDGAVYGSVGFCIEVSDKLNWTIHQNHPNWTIDLPLFLTKRRMRLKSFFDYRKEDNKRYLESIDRKIITPDVYVGYEHLLVKNEFVRHVNSRDYEKIKLIASEPVDWLAKYRCLVVNGRLVSISSIYADDFFSIPKNEIKPVEYMSYVLTYVNTAPSCVIDIGYIDGRGWAVNKSLPVYSADPYQLDIDKFIDALVISCSKESEF